MRQLAIWFVLRYFRFFARIALFVHRPLVLGIAGSVGKTSTKYVLSHILSAAGKTAVTSGNSETGIPLGILGIALHGYSPLQWLLAMALCPFKIFHLRRVKFLVAEMGIDDPYPPKNMTYLLSIVEPDIAVLVTESVAHTMQFDKVLTDAERALPDGQRIERLVAAIANEDAKMAMTQRCSAIIYNADSSFITGALARGVPTRVKRIHFGHAHDASFRYRSYDVSPDRTAFSFTDKRLTHSLGIRGYALPEEYREVFAAALLAAREAGVSIETGIESLNRGFALPKGRASVLNGIGNSTIIDSSYNASRASTVAFLKLMNTLKEKTGRPTVMLFGDMRELGEETKAEHETVFEHMPGTIDYLFCVGPLTKEYILPAAQSSPFQRVKWFSDAVSAGSYLAQHLPERSLVLVKGSQNGIFLEEAIKFILADPQDAGKLCRQEKYWKKGF
ncbi:MAG: hypothetical protein A3B30_02810 [Candidatus Komeilibacteria bacterium RIFCSPLOWO2_01_FULL_52_15]|uniref:Mur ligase central domain-containing protein n=2 Tax=Candidatus Komeiliibacteriota TaxID=1817908 RepID=A0A1G2BPD6_9BACT|nr:MAG: hypothetical protein A2677_02135 [Candidatus Komeilibacteria bacterium RIFCSPHIGHO2_01_FULL_52_14]OGY90666.1 MAG: hypothetical protein A3B30_02810 [Candidatus Komeilibacteria bacterium RIFCSPLOWO2_01_FULL_52_15]